MTGSADQEETALEGPARESGVISPHDRAHAGRFGPGACAGELSGSRTLALFVGMLHDIVALHIQAVARGIFSSSLPQAARGAAAEHRAHVHLLERAQAGDPAAAEAHWRAHPEAAGRQLFPGLESKTLVDLFG